MVTPPEKCVRRSVIVSCNDSVLYHKKTFKKQLVKMGSLGTTMKGKSVTATNQQTSHLLNATLAKTPTRKGAVSTHQTTISMQQTWLSTAHKAATLALTALSLRRPLFTPRIDKLEELTTPCDVLLATTRRVFMQALC